MSETYIPTDQRELADHIATLEWAIADSSGRASGPLGAALDRIVGDA
jgi:hypothetical protein